MANEQRQPLTFFLNERHELSAIGKEGGGALPKYAAIQWASRARKIKQSINAVKSAVQASRDPIKNSRYFVVAVPVPTLEKESTDKKKAPNGTYKEATNYGGQHNKVFDRLGMDLLQVADDGRALVHAERDRFEQIAYRAESLPSLGPKEQSRWATIDSFDVPSIDLRVDANWLKNIRKDDLADFIIELQPMLVRREADSVLRSLADFLHQLDNGQLTGTGSDFSGRRWLRGKASRNSIRSIAKEYFSVQAIHAPLYSIAAALGRRRPSGPMQTAANQPIDIAGLPCIAVVDTGVPHDHVHLNRYRRGQFYGQDVPRSAVGDHGSLVASRIVFGDHSSADKLQETVGECAFFDVMVGDFPGPHRGDHHVVDDKVVMGSMLGTRGAAPDVRVFNLSIGDHKSFGDYDPVAQREKRLLLQDLDNFAFANDSAIIVAAGNSRPGVEPTETYPNHYADPRWALGPWSSGFNTWVCGSYVSELGYNGVVKHVGWPSAFTRVGPGICGSPIPSFGAPGGDCGESYQTGVGNGVWAYSAEGLPEDHCGSSFAAPILAREVAFTLKELQQRCLPGSHPFAVTAKAFLALTATRTCSDSVVKTLSERTLGYGKASMSRLRSPTVGSAVILWQGMIESSRDTIRVQLPIPIDWLGEAKRPVLHLIVCSDPPVNESSQALWATRRVVPRLYLGPDSVSVRAPKAAHGSYPLIVRRYALEKYKPGEDKAAESDMWLLELSYEEISPYVPGNQFDPRQRVALAAELIDEDDSPVDPQLAMQALPSVATMDRLAIQTTQIQAPIIIRASR